MRYYVPAILISAFCLSCDSQKIAQLQSENESLRKELAARESMLQDINRQIERLEALQVAVSQAPKKDPELSSAMRLKNSIDMMTDQIMAFVKKMEKLEEHLADSENEAFAYLMMVDALKGEVGIRDGEILQMTDSVAYYESRTLDVEASLQVKEQAIDELYRQIHEKQQKLVALEQRVDHFVRLSEADQYFLKAKVLEESARKVRLAPQRRKETFLEALELYKKSLALGKQEAAQRIENIRKMFQYEEPFTAASNVSPPAE